MRNSAAQTPGFAETLRLLRQHRIEVRELTSSATAAVALVDRAASARAVTLLHGALARRPRAAAVPWADDAGGWQVHDSRSVFGSCGDAVEILPPTI